MDLEKEIVNRKVVYMERVAFIADMHSNIVATKEILILQLIMEYPLEFLKKI